MIKSYYKKKAARYFSYDSAAMEDEDFKTAEYYFGEYENYKKGAGSVPKDTVRDQDGRKGAN